MGRSFRALVGSSVDLPVRIVLASLIALMLVVPSFAHAKGLSPESPQVQEMIARGIGYLEREGNHLRLGGKALLALTLIKGHVSPNHVKVREGVEACRQAARTIEGQHTDDAMYDLSLAIIFLSELDPVKYRSEIQSLMRVMLRWQKPFGGWGYLAGSNAGSGDTSMTQYAVLALWTADRHGAVPVDVGAATRVCNWLLRTQDPSGGWGYQGVDPGSMQRVSQLGVQHSLSAAGSSSSYILADLLRLAQGMNGKPETGAESAVRVVAKKTAGKSRPVSGPLTKDVDRGRLRDTLTSADSWFNAKYSIETDDYQYYYMYAFERYQSFRELLTQRPWSRAPWYDEGVTYLQRLQEKSGSWSGVNGRTVDTCFALLFLLRGTQRSIQKAEAYHGRMRGGRGLPGGSAGVTVTADGQVVAKPFEGTAENLLSLLETADDQSLDEGDRDYHIALSENPVERARQMERLRRLVAAEKSAVRKAALRAIASTRDLDNVPILIFALADPDAEIVHEAQHALRILSRKLDGYQLPDEPTEGAKLEAVDFWKQWYRTIRPDAQFLN